MNYASNVFRHTHTKQHHFRFRNKNEPSEVSKRRHNWNNNSIPTNVIFRFRHLKCTCWDFVKFPSRLRRSCNDDTTERDKFLMPYLRTLSQLTFAMLRFRGRATKKIVSLFWENEIKFSFVSRNWIEGGRTIFMASMVKRGKVRERKDCCSDTLIYVGATLTLPFGINVAWAQLRYFEA